MVETVLISCMSVTVTRERGPNLKILRMSFEYDYMVTIQVMSNLPLTSKQKFCFSMRSIH